MHCTRLQVHDLLAAGAVPNHAGLGLGRLVVRELRRDRRAALLQQPLEVVEYIRVLQQQLQSPQECNTPSTLPRLPCITAMCSKQIHAKADDRREAMA